MTSSARTLRTCSVVVVGDVILDEYFMGDVRRVSPEAPVPLVRVREKTTTLGGAGNVALNVIGLESRASLIGLRGQDQAGDRLSELLRGHGIWDGLAIEWGRTTTSKTRVIGNGQHLVRLDEEDTRRCSVEVREALLSKFLDRLPGADVVILSDYAKGVLDSESTGELITRSRAAGIPVLVDPRGKDWTRYHGATCITPNINELEIASGVTIDDNDDLLIRTASALRQQCDAQWLLVTLGARGMCLLGEADPMFISATAREVFDVSGAGDTVAATLAVAIVSGMPMPEAAAVSNAAAGIVVGKLGSQPVRLAELEGTLRIHGVGARSAGMGKITTAEAAQAQIKVWQAAGDEVVYVAGAFDGLQPGHIHVLRQAKDLGQRLVVGLYSDADVSRARTPQCSVSPEHDRAYVLSALGCTDLVVLLQDRKVDALLEMLRPDIVIRTSLTGAVAAAADGASCRFHHLETLDGFEEM